MRWIIPAIEYKVWPQFSINCNNNLIFETGFCYYLSGDNGTGKTSFITKVFLPKLISDVSSQYIIYLEQHGQIQFDILKAYESIHNVHMHLGDEADLFSNLLELLSKQLRLEKRPIVIIIDESIYSDILDNWISAQNDLEICLLYIAHHDYIFKSFGICKSINFMMDSQNSSIIRL